MQQIKTGKVYRNLVMCSLSIALMAGCQANKTSFKIGCPDQAEPIGPVCIDPAQCQPNGLDAFEPGVYRVTCGGKNETIAQADAQGRLWMMAGAAIDEPAVCTAEPLAEGTVKNRVAFKKVADGRIDVYVHGELLTTFHFAQDDRIPYLYPVAGPMGIHVTRDYPMADRPFEREHKRQDHPHHQSFWTAWGDLRTGDFSHPGTNYWHSKPGAGQQRVTNVEMHDGAVFGDLVATIEWQRFDGRREMTERRSYRFYAYNPTAGNRVIDVAVRFEMTDSDVMFADTKEGGLLSLRLNPEIDEVGGGTMVNALGGRGAKECWGAASPWCDYYGTINGQVVGVSVMDHPDNFRHPTRWHIRDYGLFTANPFGLSHFISKEHNGSQVWKQGDEVTFNYRVVVHSGDTEQADIADQFYYYANPALPCGEGIHH